MPDERAPEPPAADGPEDLHRRVHRMDKHEIMSLFASYGFKDSEGHLLTRCADFLDLLDRAEEP